MNYLEFRNKMYDLACFSIDLKSKMKDFEHLLFDKRNSERILRVEAFFEEL